MNRFRHNAYLTQTAKQLRKNLTKHERKLWYGYLSKQPEHYSRQKVIGEYILDFYCAERKLAIELDGVQHYGAEAVQFDRQRDEYLAGLGITVLRFGNREIEENFPTVCSKIEKFSK